MENQVANSNPNPVRKKNRVLITVIIVLSVIILFTGISFLVMIKYLRNFDEKYVRYETGGKSAEKIAVVDLNYTIISSQNFSREMKMFGEDKSIKAIILRVDSPGGGTAMSHEMYEAVKRVRDGGKPVIVSVGSVCASGAYYVSCGASLIVANPSSVVGSIGVISQYVTFKELAEKIGIKDVTVKSAESKDIGNPFRDATEKDRATIQDVIDDSYDLFVGIVSEERKINIDSVKMLATGRVYTGRQALKYRMIDSIGTFDDAVRIAARIAKIEGEPTLVREKSKRNIVDILISGKSDNTIREIENFIRNEYLNRPLLQYKFELNSEDND